MATIHSFIRLILEDPTRHDVFADWLEDQMDPRADQVRKLTPSVPHQLYRILRLFDLVICPWCQGKGKQGLDWWAMTPRPNQCPYCKNQVVVNIVDPPIHQRVWEEYFNTYEQERKKFTFQ